MREAYHLVAHPFYAGMGVSVLPDIATAPPHKARSTGLFATAGDQAGARMATSGTQLRRFSSAVLSSKIDGLPFVHVFFFFFWLCLFFNFSLYRLSRLAYGENMCGVADEVIYGVSN